VYPGVPFSEYLAWDAVSASFLKDMEHTPRYAMTKKQDPREEKDCYSKGRLFHALCFEPQTVESAFAIEPTTYQSDKGEVKPWHNGANVCKAWRASNADKTCIDQETFDESAAMAARVRAMPQLAPFLSDAQVELSAVYIDSQTGLLCKMRMDAFKNGIILDAKSTSSTASRDGFNRECQQHRYYLQAAHYIEGAKALRIAAEVPWFAFVAVEGYKPYDLAVFDVQDDTDALSFDFLHYGRLKRRILLNDVRNCKDKGEWPGYVPDSFDCELTFQARKELEEMTQISGAMR
jgi:hypothetical protein